MGWLKSRSLVEAMLNTSTIFVQLLPPLGTLTSCFCYCIKAMI
jgi:hypothetical protein